MKLSAILNRSLASLSKASKTTLKQMYSMVKKEVGKRVSTYKKHGAEKYLPDDVKKLAGVNSMNSDDLALNITNLSNFLRSPKASYTKYMKERKENMERVEEMIDYNFEDEEDYENYERFLSEMYKRDKVMWKQHYDEAMELYAQGRRLNLDPMQFVRNYEYWLDSDKIEALSNAEPIERDRLSPSDYARKLKLPKIRGGGSYGD